MTRRTNLTILAAALASAAPLTAKENDSMKELLETSQNDKKGVMVYVKGQSIGGVVLKISGDIVEMRSREYSRIVVKLEAIDAVAMA